MLSNCNIYCQTVKDVCIVYDLQCADDIPITSRLEVTHTGVGLAWSYFYGYLNIVLPGKLCYVFNMKFSLVFLRYQNLAINVIAMFSLLVSVNKNNAEKCF